MSWGIAFRLRQQLKGSMWFLPFLAAVAGPLVGQVTLWLDGVVQLPEAWRYSAATATGVLSVLVGAMVGLLGFVVTLGELCDKTGRPRVVLPVRRWEDYLELGVTEIREYGATSVQVARRLRALLIQLLADAPPPHRIAVEAELSELDVSVAESFPTDADRTLAGESDRQGIGGPARVRPRSG